MIRLFFVMIMLCSAAHAELSGVHLSDKSTIEADAVHPEVLNKADAVHVEIPVKLSTAKGTVLVEHVLEVNAPKDMIHTDPITVTTTVDKPTLNLNVAEKSVNAPLTFTANIPKEAVVCNITMSIDKEAFKDAVVIHGAEKGSITPTIQTNIPSWLIILTVFLGLGWIITKFRKHHKTRSINNESFWDFPF